MQILRHLNSLRNLVIGGSSLLTFGKYPGSNEVDTQTVTPPASPINLDLENNNSPKVFVEAIERERKKIQEQRTTQLKL